MNDKMTLLKLIHFKLFSGEVLRGDRIVNTPYKVSIQPSQGLNKAGKSICKFLI